MKLTKQRLKEIIKEELLNEVPLRIRGVKQNLIDASDALWQTYKDLKSGADMRSDTWKAYNDGAQKAKKLQDEVHKLHQKLRKNKIV